MNYLHTKKNMCLLKPPDMYIYWFFVFCFVIDLVRKICVFPEIKRMHNTFRAVYNNEDKNVLRIMNNYVLMELGGRPSPLNT